MSNTLNLPCFSHPHWAWLALLQLKGLARKDKRLLLNRFGSPESILTESRATLLALGVAEEALSHRNQLLDPGHAKAQAIQHALAWLESPVHHLICLGQPEYPPLLAEIPDPPLLLFVIGDPAVLLRPQLAVVGSRKPSHSGRQNARHFARALAETGFSISSGLALGVDGEAHQGCLDGQQPTVAVMATGADMIYPRRHRDLAGRIVETGALVTEFPLGTTPLPALFPQRNRIISGLSVGTLVVEAASRSGSLITARFALEQGREVFAMPGSIHNPQAKGCNELIRQGAKLTETVDDVVTELQGILPTVITPKQPSTKAAVLSTLNPVEQRVLDTLDDSPVSMDEISVRSGLSTKQLGQTLTLLELQDLVVSVAGGFVRNSMT